MARGQPQGEEVYRPEVQPEDLPRKITPEIRDVGQVGSAISHLGDAMQAKYHADSATFASDQLGDFRVKVAQNLQEMQENAPPGDPGDFTERFLQQYDKQAGPLADNAASNPIARNMIERGVHDFRNTLAMHVMGWEAEQRKSYQNQSIDDNLNRQLTLVRQHPEAADQVGSTLGDAVRATTNTPATKFQMMRTIHSALTEAAGLGLAAQNPGEVYTQLMSGEPKDSRLAEISDPAARERVLAAARGGVIKNFADGALEKYRMGGPQAGQAAYAAVDKLTLPGTPVEQEDMREKIRDEIHKGRGALIAEQQQKMAPQVIALEEAVHSGDPAKTAQARGLVWNLYRQNALEPHVVGATLGQLDATDRKNADDQAGMALIQRALKGEVMLDPKDKDQQKDSATTFNAIATAANATPGSQAYTNLAAHFAQTTGMIPSPVGDWARSVLVGSKDPNQVVSAVDLIDRVREASPRSWSYFEDDHKIAAMSDSIRNLTRSGIPPDQAVTIARANAAQGDADRKHMDDLWRIARPFGAENAALEGVIKSQVGADPKLSEIGWLWNTTPAIPNEMQAEYEAATRAIFNYNGGKIAEAEALAAKNIATPWGLTRMNGDPEISRYPPERMFPGLTAEDIRTDIAQTVAGGTKPREPEATGLVQKGTIKDLFNRPILKNADGTISTTLSFSVATDKGETLLPQVIDGKKLTRDEALTHFRQTGEHLGIFDTAAHADAYAEALHNAQAAYIHRQSGESPDFQHWDADKRELATFHVEPENVHLASTAKTVTTSGRTWGLIYVGEDGTAEAIYGKNGKPIEYDLPVSKGDYAALRAQATKDQLEQQDKEYKRRSAEEAEMRKWLAEDGEGRGMMGH